MGMGSDYKTGREKYLVTFTSASKPTTPRAGEIVYFSDGDGGSPCAAIYIAGDWHMIITGSIIHNP